MAELSAASYLIVSFFGPNNREGGGAGGSPISGGGGLRNKGLQQGSYRGRQGGCGGCTGSELRVSKWESVCGSGGSILVCRLLSFFFFFPSSPWKCHPRGELTGGANLFRDLVRPVAGPR